ncbi:hypothetical protein Fmac_024349 [Flemingia macrophylla]|uniref:RIN4 pathogenic type III effector avirulence factor Avr cleavage site domain-containing protein n=1 Tax=Flemingia macrophylla TaxID=520843 RepID=A0ABD1LP46_9FABA
MDECKRNGHNIPAFGNWDFTNEMPITRYFECATQPRQEANKGLQQDDTVPRTPKPIDEDLYKIPPELLHTSNKRRPRVSAVFVELNWLSWGWFMEEMMRMRLQKDLVRRRDESGSS